MLRLIGFATRLRCSAGRSKIGQPRLFMTLTIRKRMNMSQQIYSAGILTLLLTLVNSTFAKESDENLRRFLKSYCVNCHGEEAQEGEVAFHDASLEFDDTDTANLWLAMLEQLRAGDMPPPEETNRPSEEEQNAVMAWLDRQLLTAGSGEAYRKKLLAPEYGNWVDHDQLFSGEIETPPFSPSRLWRLSPEIFAYKGFGRSKSPYNYVTSARGLRDYAAMSVADQSTVQMMMIVADSFLAEREQRGEFKEFADGQTTLDEERLQAVINREFSRVIGRFPTEDEQKKYLDFLKLSMETGGPLDGLKTAIKAMFLSPDSIYRMEFGLGAEDEYGRRHLSTSELAHAIAFALTDQAPDRNRFIREALEEGRLTTQSDVARLVRQMLDEQLTTGHWDRKDLARIMRFFDEFFGFHRAGTVFKDNDRQRAEKIPQWNTDMLIHDARMLIQNVLKKDQDVIAELLTTNEYFIAHPGDNVYAREHYDKRVAEVIDPGFVEAQIEKRREQIARDFNFVDMPEKAEAALEAARKDAEKTVLKYKTALEQDMFPFPGYPFTHQSRGIGDLIYIEPYNLPSSNRIEQQRWDWPLEQPFEMPADQRAGLLTHPAWLAAYSWNEDNDPIHRGIWIYERLLAGVLGDVPPDVDAAVPTDPHKTLRERMEPLRSERCWKCHRKINPLGEPFEMFDDWGRHRTKHYYDEEGNIYMRRDGNFDRKLADGKLTTRDVDASGKIEFTGDPAIDGEVSNAVEMMHRLGRSERARQSFIRHLFRYFMGRNEMLSDSKTLIEAEEAYLASGGSFKALVVSLLSSDSFIYRR